MTTNGGFEGVNLDTLIRNVTEHGYGSEYGSQIAILVQLDDTDIIMTFRAGQVAVDGCETANDFIPARMPLRFCRMQLCAPGHV